jgi:LysR family glycine cleavage system transcriptional activator
MLHRPPPIATLRALEAAARHLNFTKAADELCVTQSAVSHQIRHLEDLWNLKLFDRPPRGLVLTRNGQALAPVVRNFFERLSETLETLKSEVKRDPLRIDTLQSFAVKWLVPRINEFHNQFPDIDLWISTHDELVNFATENVDLTIRLGQGNYPGLHSTLLLKEYVFPVCSPDFIEKVGMPSSHADLHKLPLLLRLGDPAHPNWEDWFSQVGEEEVVVVEGPRFPDTNMALQAAKDGQGIALARSAHVCDDLKAGKLVKLFNYDYPSNVSYFLVCPSGKEDTPKIASVREWLLAEASMAQVEYDKISRQSSI